MPRLKVACLVLMLAAPIACQSRHGEPVPGKHRGDAGARDASAPPSGGPACEIFEAYRRGEQPKQLALDPVRFWRDFEECYAKDRSPCERALLMTLALPSMAKPKPDELARQKADYLAACVQLPNEVQRCLTSYAMDHTKDCEKLRPREQLNAALKRQQQR